MIASFVGWGRGMRDDGFHPFFGVLMMVLCLAAVAAVVWLVASRRPQHHPPMPPGPPAAWPATPPDASPTAAAEAILAERLARGEIPAEEYTSLLATLRGTPPA